RGHLSFLQAPQHFVRISPALWRPPDHTRQEKGPGPRPPAASAQACGGHRAEESRPPAVMVPSD
ncbi:unnamed protein product, partial [Gulo gulo]